MKIEPNRLLLLLVSSGLLWGAPLVSQEGDTVQERKDAIDEKEAKKPRERRAPGKGVLLRRAVRIQQLRRLRRQPGGDDRPVARRQVRGGPSSFVLRFFDADGDGKISKKEWKSFFKASDVDGDGAISAEELRSAIRARIPVSRASEGKQNQPRR